MGDLTSLKLAGDLHLVSVFDEPDRVLHKEAKIVFSNTRTDFYTLYFGLLALLILTKLAFRVLVTAVVDNFANGRVGGRRHDDEVEALFPRLSKSCAALA